MSYQPEPVQTFRTISEDFGKDYRQNYLAGKPWIFNNKLPYPVNVYVYRTDKTDLIGSIAPRSQISAIASKTGMVLRAGDEIHVFWPDNHSKLYPKKTLASKPVEYEIARSVFLFDDSRTVNIGDIVYEDRVSTSPAVDIWHDIIGIRFHNHLSFPVDVYYQNLKIGAISGDDGTDYMAGSPNSVYLNNDRFGFKIGSEIKFVFARDNIELGTVKLLDNYVSDIIIGETTQHFVMARQDQFAYRINSPNITGLTYFNVDSESAYGKTFALEDRSKSKGCASGPGPYLSVLAAGGGVKL